MHGLCHAGVGFSRMLFVQEYSEDDPCSKMIHAAR